MKDFLTKLVVEGGRVFWTAVEAVAGVVAGVSVPDDLLDVFGAYETTVRGAVVVAIASLAAFLKEKARARLDPATP